MRLHYFQHVDFEDLAGIEDWARRNGHTITATRFDLKQTPPDIRAMDALVVLGGPMNIYEEDLYPWLATEKRSIRQAIDDGKKVLGICLGSQLIADVLGAKVIQNPQKEIGWFPLHLTQAAMNLPLFAGLPPSFTVFHWHGDTFTLPEGAVHLAASEACKNQAFLVGERVLGLQFHPESNLEEIRRMIQFESEDMTPGQYVQSDREILEQENYYQENRKILHTVLDRFFR